MTQQRAVIFDMDGVIVDSEGYWKQAEYEILKELGIQVSDEDSEKTKTMTTAAATKFWFDKFSLLGINMKVVEELVVSKVILLIQKNECQIDGVKEFILNLKNNHYKIGLATNSPERVIPVVLQKLGISNLFDALSSAEFEEQGKPDPAVYLSTANRLGVLPENCIAIEDSLYGMLAAKNAGMTVIAFTNGNPKTRFDVADFHITTFKDFDMNLFTKDTSKVL